MSNTDSLILILSLFRIDKLSDQKRFWSGRCNMLFHFKLPSWIMCTHCSFRPQSSSPPRMCRKTTFPTRALFFFFFIYYIFNLLLSSAAAFGVKDYRGQIVNVHGLGWAREEYGFNFAWWSAPLTFSRASFRLGMGCSSGRGSGKRGHIISDLALRPISSSGRRVENKIEGMKEPLEDRLF